jgi:predicted glycosyltransferase
MSKHVFLYVQHLLGVGHAKRTALLARALRDRGMTIEMAFGGMEVPGLDTDGVTFHQLPPVRMGKDYRDLIDIDGRSVDDAWKAARRDRLVGLFQASQANALITELFPFGRPQMAFELVPLLEAARACSPRPAVISSVRDMLAADRAPKRIAETLDRLDTFYDQVLVHADPMLARIEETFPRADEIRHKLHYTGLVADTSATGGGAREGVVVSAGGGAFSESLLATAIPARALSTLAAEPWHLILGPNLEPAAKERIRRAATPGIVDDEFRDDFPAFLARTRVSISRGGYNTIADVFAAGPRVVIVPFTGAGETEQPMRAERLASRGLAQMVDETDLSPQSLAAAVDAAVTAAPADAAGLDLDGAATSARLIGGWLE